MNHEDLEALKGESAFAFNASGEEVFEVFVVRFYCPCLNRRAGTEKLDTLSAFSVSVLWF